MRLACTCLLALLAAGCTVGNSGGPPGALEDATVIVQRAVNVPANTRYVWFQGGSPQRRLTEFWAPYCKLRVGGDTDKPRLVTPGRFAVAWVRHEYTVGQRETPQLALRGDRTAAVGIPSADNPDADPMYVAPELVISLRSSDQPHVRQLTCGVRRGTTTLRDPPSLADMAAALGDYLRIEPRADASLASRAGVPFGSATLTVTACAASPIPEVGMSRNSLYALLGALTLGAPVAAQAGIASGEVVYEVDGERFEGYYARNTALGDSQPVVLIVHDWDGLTDYEKQRAGMLAREGYAAFVVDLFGEGIRPESVEHRRALTGALYEDRARMRELLQAGMSAMADQAGFDEARVVAMGYCFGGTAVLEMARAGMEADGFVTFHGGLGTPAGQDYRAVTAPLLILHGTRDQAVPLDTVTDLADRLDAAGVDFRMELYGGARHAFTVWGGDRYQPAADLRSWQALREFLAERL